MDTIKNLKQPEMENGFFTNPVDIVDWLTQRGIESFTVFPKDGKFVVNAHQNVNLSGKLNGYEHLPVSFNEVNGNFDMSNNDSVISLKGSPLIVGKDFHCNNTSIVNLMDGPVFADTYNASFCELESLQGSPKEVSVFSIQGNENLVSLAHGPEKIHWMLSAHLNPNLSLEGYVPNLTEDARCAYFPPHLTLQVNGMDAETIRIRVNPDELAEFVENALLLTPSHIEQEQNPLMQLLEENDWKGLSALFDEKPMLYNKEISDAIVVKIYDPMLDRADRLMASIVHEYIETSIAYNKEREKQVEFAF